MRVNCLAPQAVPALPLPVYAREHPKPESYGDNLRWAAATTRRLRIGIGRPPLPSGPRPHPDAARGPVLAIRVQATSGGRNPSTPNHGRARHPDQRERRPRWRALARVGRYPAASGQDGFRRIDHAPRCAPFQCRNNAHRLSDLETEEPNPPSGLEIDKATARPKLLRSLLGAVSGKPFTDTASDVPSSSEPAFVHVPASETAPAPHRSRPEGRPFQARVHASRNDDQREASHGHLDRSGSPDWLPPVRCGNGVHHIKCRLTLPECLRTLSLRRFPTLTENFSRPSFSVSARIPSQTKGPPPRPQPRHRVRAIRPDWRNVAGNREYPVDPTRNLEEAEIIPHEWRQRSRRISGRFHSSTTNIEFTLTLQLRDGLSPPRTVIPNTWRELG